MRKLLFGLVGLLALGFGGLSAAPAEAQPYYGPGYRHDWGGPPVVTVQYGPRRSEWRRRGYRPPPRYRPYRPYYRPAYVGRRCFIRPGRPVWNGYRWVRPPVRVCRW